MLTTDITWKVKVTANFLPFLTASKVRKCHVRFAEPGNVASACGRLPTVQLRVSWLF